MQRVVGIEIGDEAAAYALDLVREADGKATSISLGGDPLVILWKTGQSSALDTREVSGATDVGSVAVFSPEVNGEELDFAFVEGSFVDADTGSEWTITGEAVSGPLAGTQLNQVAHLDTFWFAWSTYKPGTTLIAE